MVPGTYDAEYEAEIEAWRRDRLDSLVREDGWLAQVALHWLTDEPLLIEGVGTFTACAEGAHFEAAAASALQSRTLLDDSHGKPDVVRTGTRTFQIVRRGEAAAVRERDASAPARREFRGLEWYAIERAWRIYGRLVPDPRSANMTFTLGQEELVSIPGQIVFSLDGREAHLTPYARQGGELLIVFRDATNGDTTCDLCRYIYAPPPDRDRVVLDFNKAAAPICAFVPTVTCVLPPPENKLPFRIDAGEKRYR